MPETIGVTLRFPMEGYEEAQQKLDQIKAQEVEVEQKAVQVSRSVSVSMSRAMVAIGTGVSLLLSVTDLLGIYVDEQHKLLARSATFYFQQLAMIATSLASNPATAALAVTTATAAFALEAEAARLQHQQQEEARRALQQMNTIGDRLSSLIRQAGGLI